LALMPPWKPGESGNGLGVAVTARGIAMYARKRTRNGKELVDFMLGVMRGEPLPVRATRNHRARYPQTPKVEHRMVAAQWLADRGWGKAKELIELQGDAPTTPEQRLALLRRLSDDERAQLRALLAKALASPPTDSVGPSDSREAPTAGEAGAPELLGQPRNVGRALAPELEVSDLEADLEPVSPAVSPAAPDNPAPA
jgi:hypothetical protein